MDDGFIAGNQLIVIKMVLISFVIFTVIIIADLLKEKKRIDISAKLQYKLSKESTVHLMKIKYNYFDDKNYAEILNKLSTDIGNMTSIADESVFFVVTQVFSMIGGIIGLFLLDVRMTFLVLLFIPIKYVIMKYFAKYQKKLIDEYICDSEVYAAWFGDTIGGIKEVKLNNLYSAKEREFDIKQSQLISKQKQINMLRQWNGAADTILVRLLISLIYIVGSNLVFSMELSVGSVFAFITYSTYVTGPISAILNISYLMAGIIPSSIRYFEFMELKEEKNEDGNSRCSLNEGIKIERVSFSYNKETEVLKDISFAIGNKEKIAIVGKNGSGKSTLMDLILLIYNPTNGVIKYGDKNILELDLYEYRKLFSVVSQDIYLFNTSIRDNICLYTEIDDEKIYEICVACGLKDFIDQVSMEYEVGQNGTKLSGGQKQKIALVRAIIQDNPIIVLDEATSSSDSYSEKQIDTLLHSLLAEKTVIIITHKSGVLKNVDKIIEIDVGRVRT